MGNAVRRVIGESQKNIVKTMERPTGRFSLWEIWQDFIIMSAISIANTVDTPFRDSREQTYRGSWWTACIVLTDSIFDKENTAMNKTKIEWCDSDG